MIKIVLPVPYNGFIEDSFSIFSEHNQWENLYMSSGNKETYELEEIIFDNYDNSKNPILKGDVIIARGVTARAIKRQNYNTPIVEVPIAVNDVLLSLHESKRRYGKRTVGVIVSESMIPGVNNLSEIVGLDIQLFFLRPNSDIANVIDNACRSGCEVIVGGQKACEYAKEKDINNVFLKYGKDSFWQALTEAKRLAKVSIKEQERAQRFRTLLDHSKEGIVSVDSNGIIQVLNSAAEKILAIKEKEVVGKSAYDALTEKSICDAIDDENECSDEIIKYKNIQLTFNKLNIMLKDKKVGSIITFEDITKVQLIEEKIRKKIYSKGLVAKYTFDNIIGKSRIIKQTIETAKRYSKVNSNILILGESGTGKELFAQSIHNMSSRRNRPFVAINCAALPESLLESELFGYVEGAFTGANKTGKPGIFELAHTGTIFLDEIGEMPLKLQSRLLRVLQEREIMRLGGDKVIPVDVRIISATNKDIFAQSNDGSFRQDLYYRLDILSLYLPSLCERKEDIPLLVDHFMNNNEELVKNNIVITDEAKKLLQGYDWPGNIRQLRNVCERLAVLSEDNIIKGIDIENVLMNITRVRTHLKHRVVEQEAENCTSWEEQVKDIEKERILKALSDADYNKGEAAKILGINRTTLWRQMKNLGIR